jgi:hypothetical protein
MPGSYKFSILRPSGWTRLGVAGAIGVFFATPMLWALGVFGDGEPALQRALVFMLSAVWFFVATFYTIGWALKGFVVRMKEAEDEEEAPAHRPSAPPPPRPAGPPPQRPQR